MSDFPANPPADIPAKNSLLAASLRAALEGALNLALNADPASQQKLAALAGKTIALEITDLNLNWCLHLNYPLILLDAGTSPTNSQLSGRLQDFIGLGVKNSASLSLSGITHTGDIQLLNSSLSLIKTLDLDLGQLVGSHLGPLSGALASKVQGLFTPLAHTLNKAPQFLGDFLQHELQLIPSKNHIEAFTDDIYALRSRTDRLMAKMERLNLRLDQALQSPALQSPAPHV